MVSPATKYSASEIKRLPVAQVCRNRVAGNTATRAAALTTKTRAVAFPLCCGKWRAGSLSPVRSWLPPHHRHGGEAIEGGPLDHPCAIREIHQRPVRQIDQPHDLGLLKDERRLHAK